MARITIMSDKEGRIYLQISRAQTDDFWTILGKLRTTVPQYYRRFLKEERVWCISREGKVYVLQLLARLEGFVEVVKLTTEALEDPFSTLFVANAAPLEVVQAAYKALAKTHHPDHGGDSDSMERLNSAYDAIRKMHDECI